MFDSAPPRAARLACAALTALLVSCGASRDPDVLLADTGKSVPSEVRLTWIGVANWTVKIGDLNILIGGAMTRVPQDKFYGGGSGLAHTTAASPIDKAAVDKARNVLTDAPGAPINLVLTGTSQFDHSFDTPYWAGLTKAMVAGAHTTCYQVQALGVPASQCTPVNGGETLQLNKYVTLRVVRWNAAGSHDTDPEQHDPVELQKAPQPDAAGNLRAGVTEDFPNGGGSRGYLFTVKTGNKSQLSFFITAAGAAQDLAADSIVDGTNYGKPVDSLAHAMSDAKLKGVDLWIGSGGQPVAALALPVLKPKAYLPNHLGSVFLAFEKGNTEPFRDTALATWLAANKVALVPPLQYMDAFVLDANGVRPVDNTTMKKAYGF